VLAELREETALMQGARMQVAPEQGQLMALLARLLGVRRYLEIGVFTGYSALAVALALPDDGLVVGLEQDAKSMQVARRYWRRAGVEGKVRVIVGPALKTLVEVKADFGPHSFDMAFIGARLQTAFVPCDACYAPALRRCMHACPKRFRS
jgi:O-methyltransferase